MSAAKTGSSCKSNQKRRNGMMNSRMFKSVLAVGAILMATASSASAQTSTAQGVKTLVLVHGAWSNSSSWSKVIPLLEAGGFHVVAVQLPLTSLVDDVAAVKRALALEDGPVLLVAHSYGGAVITEAGTDPKVAGLVYIAAVAPDRGESAFGLITSVATPVGAELRPDSMGFLKLTPKGIAEDFAQGLSTSEISVLTATQAPTNVAAMKGEVTTPAWKSKPSFYVIAARDRTISPELEATMAKKINATTITIPSPHVVMLAEPAQLTAFIAGAAAKAAQN
ncbi:alpha/beta fold hydrolase [Paludibaculum fermentans]|uniref:alpha/beta fold hydrolase n=1 Tax=Paludibaculum fermentans TaxID=1473598 RepID=UPI003EBE594B